VLFVIEHREALIYMLCQAAELEHGLMCQYLRGGVSRAMGDGPRQPPGGHTHTGTVASARRTDVATAESHCRGILFSGHLE
jgi:hypothetical protein